MSVQSSLVMYPINQYGSDQQKEKYLPPLGELLLEGGREGGRDLGKEGEGGEGKLLKQGRYTDMKSFSSFCRSSR